MKLSDSTCFILFHPYAGFHDIGMQLQASVAAQRIRQWGGEPDAKENADVEK